MSEPERCCICGWGRGEHADDCLNRDKDAGMPDTVEAGGVTLDLPGNCCYMERIGEHQKVYTFANADEMRTFLEWLDGREAKRADEQG